MRLAASIRKKIYVQALYWGRRRWLHWIPASDTDNTTTVFTTISHRLVRNKCLAQKDLLLVPPPRTLPQPQPSNRNTTNGFIAATTMWKKTCHLDVAQKFAKIPNKAGASAIFKLFQACPALLEKRITAPVPPVAAETRPITAASLSAAAAAAEASTADAAEPNPTSLPKRKSCTSAETSATEQVAAKRTRRHAGGDGDVDASSLPTRHLDPSTRARATTTATTTTTLSSGTLLEEANRFNETLVDQMKALFVQGDHEQATLLLAQQEEATLQLKRLFSG